MRRLLRRHLIRKRLLRRHLIRKRLLGRRLLKRCLLRRRQNPPLTLTSGAPSMKCPTVKKKYESNIINNSEKE
jgi:hypothetical protein